MSQLSGPASNWRCAGSFQGSDPCVFKAANDPSPRAAGCVAPYAGADPFCLALNRRWARRSLPSALRSLRGAVCSSGTPSKAVTSIETPRSMPSVMLLASNSAGRADRQATRCGRLHLHGKALQVGLANEFLRDGVFGFLGVQQSVPQELQRSGQSIEMVGLFGGWVSRALNSRINI